MNFLYKINSGYSGPGGRFTPSKIPERLIEGRYLDLGWARYIDAVDRGDSVWIYFTGPQRYQPAVYARGRVTSVDREAKSVRIGVTDSDPDSPLTDAAESARVAEAVARWYQQVFVMPERWPTAARCTVTTTATSCAEKHCEVCETWRGLPLIRLADLGWPERLGDDVDEFAPAYWVIPPRAFIGRDQVRAGIRHTSDLFKSFKAGNPHLAYPFALGIRESLRRHEIEADFEAVVPIPLSPDKAAAREIHRTRLLANELAAILDLRVVEALSLSRPISKRALLAQGIGPADFERRYGDALQVRASFRGGSVLLVDDVCTKGSTLKQAAKALRRAGVEEVVAATAGQMILRAVVVSESGIRRPAGESVVA